MGLSSPLFASTVKRNFAIHHNRHEPVIFCVLELHDLTTAARQLPPSARFLRVLFDGLVLVTIDTECGGFQMLSACASDGRGFTAHVHGRTHHQLRGDQLKVLRRALRSCPSMLELQPMVLR